jgi:ComF family protein
MPGSSRLLHTVRVAGQSLLDLFYPPQCAGCGRLGALFCPACQAAVQPYPSVCCPRCGRPTLDAGRLCPACQGRSVVIDGLLATGAFTPPLQSAIYNLKYHGVRGLVEPLGDRLAQTWRTAGLHGGVIVPVPLHPDRLAERGYNQAELLARALAERLALPIQVHALVRLRATSSQVHLNPAERRNNVYGAFDCCLDLADSQVLLIDDVCTTGATLEACATALRRRGAAAVWGLTVARAVL